jgi:hypothetical protein
MKNNYSDEHYDFHMNDTRFRSTESDCKNWTPKALPYCTQMQLPVSISH